ncbi:TolC family protein [Campylobacter sp. MIT 21-1685]|uniref:TolC family protein n=1 Tax=unclassified Campylobacter TaxID=2593542 RepID=UPI00224B4C29|nr:MULTISPECIES: TolC family protein [unclassified Campylobacter]MCX2682386.1 TolC family protein [Campylobacter sp. MIT 21-1684]MCX2750666.1 TolC family protein [Campylobacter sp. MIT 21-1682]MCX2806786.1 TolC family protein [Campylobacter sp. MIT 21-1685]
MAKKYFLFFLFALLLSSCGKKLLLPQEPADFFGESNVTWWRAYNDENLNTLVNFVLENNTDINVATVTLLSTLARTKLLQYDLYPTLDGGFELTKTKNLDTQVHSTTFGTRFALNYELDIYGKISDSANSQEFLAKASAFDLENLKLSIVNMTLNNVFELAYCNDVEKLLKEHIFNLEQMQELYKFKYELGKIEELDFLNTQQSLLRVKANLLSNEQNRNLLLKNLQDLLGKKQGFDLIEYFKTASLSNFIFLKPNFNLPLDSFFFRPDIRSKLYNLKAAFKDYSAVRKSLLPSISLAGVLSGQDKTFNESFQFQFLNGNLKISLPFLDYARVRQNIKISQFNYEKLLLEYQYQLQSALNEFTLVLKEYESNMSLMENLTILNTKDQLIALAYKKKYELGKSELKDYLNANNTVIASSQELLRAQFSLLKTINSYFQITAFSDLH